MSPTPTHDWPQINLVSSINPTIPTTGVGCMGWKLPSGNILSLPTSVKVPHIGWNQIVNVKDSYLLDGINPDSYVYFVHSFYFEVEKIQNIVAKTNYGIWFPSIVESNNVYGTQFHPEKSGKIGLKILENFLKIVKRW